MDDALRQLVDESGIRRLPASYCRVRDRADALMIGGVCAENNWDDHGIVQASGVEFTGQITAIILENTETPSHLLGQSFISIGWRANTAASGLRAG